MACCSLLRLLVVSLAGATLGRGAAPRTLQVQAGEDATLRCPLLAAAAATTTASTATKSTPTATTAAAPVMISWYRKRAGEGPRLLLTFPSSDTTNVTFGPGVTPLKVRPAADGSLTLLGSQRSDSALYYCGVSRGGDRRKDPNRREDPQ